MAFSYSQGELEGLAALQISHPASGGYQLGNAGFLLRAVKPAGLCFLSPDPSEKHMAARLKMPARSCIPVWHLASAKMRHCTTIYLMQKELFLKKVFDKCPAA